MTLIFHSFLHLHHRHSHQPQLNHHYNHFKRKNDAVTNTTQTLSSDRLIGEFERVIKKLKPKENLVPEEDIIFTLPKLPAILDEEDFEKKQEIKKNNKMMK